MRRTAALILCTAFGVQGTTAGAAEQPTLIAKRELSMLESPRNGLLCQHGKELGKLPRLGRITKYEMVKSYCGLLYSLEYVKFVHEFKPGEPVTVYVRRQENDGSDRFEVESK